MNTKLQRLAGFGPVAAFVSAGSLFVFFIVEEFGAGLAGSSPAGFVAVAIVFFLSLWLWLAGFYVVTFDLEWIEHPQTSTGRLQAARVLTFIAMVMPAVILLAILLRLPLIFQAIPNALIWGGVGVSVLVHNLDARRAGLLHGVLPWLGIVTGAALILSGIGYAAFLPIGMTVLLVAINFALLGQLLYIAWGIWLGVKLTQSKVAKPMASTAPAH